MNRAIWKHPGTGEVKTGSWYYNWAGDKFHITLDDGIRFWTYGEKPCFDGFRMMSAVLFAGIPAAKIWKRVEKKESKKVYNRYTGKPEREVWSRKIDVLFDKEMEDDDCLRTILAQIGLEADNYENPKFIGNIVSHTHNSLSLCDKRIKGEIIETEKALKKQGCKEKVGLYLLEICGETP